MTLVRLWHVAVIAAAMGGLVFAAHPPIQVVIPPSPPFTSTHVIQDNFIGISFELSSFDTLWGKTPEALPIPMQNYLHNLVARISRPLRVRVGGNGMDGSTYYRNLTTTMLELPDPEAYFNDIPAHFGPVLFDVLNAMYDKVGPMQYLVGLGMRNGHDFSNVVELAQDATRVLGGKLDSMLLGNEPDLYAGHGERDAYEITDYIPELRAAIDALTQGGTLTEGIPMVGGPTICYGWNLSDVLNAGMDELPYNYYTLQRYPNHACSGVNERNTNITYYRTHANVGPYLDWNHAGMERAKELGVPVIMTEYNSVSCGGTNISQDPASMGYTAVCLHTREHGIQYNVFDPPSPETSTEAGWRTGSPYYAALFLAELTSPEGNIVVDLDLNNGTTNQGASVAGYALYSANVRSSEKPVFINYDEGDTQPFFIPPNVTDKIEYRLLRPPSLTETTDIWSAGQTVGDHGNLVGEQDKGEETSVMC